MKAGLIIYWWEEWKVGLIRPYFAIYFWQEQYEFAHLTVQILFQKHLELMEDHIYGNVDLVSNSLYNQTFLTVTSIYQ